MMRTKTIKQIEVALLSLIALLLLYQTFQNININTDDQQQIIPETASSMGGGKAQNREAPFQPKTESQTLSNNGNPVPRALMTFDRTEVDLGTIKSGTKKRYRFHFTNNGKVRLLIQEVSTDEGLFVVSRPRDPIPVGGNGDILIEFLDNNPPGNYERVIHINSNANPTHIHLLVKAIVVA